MAGAGPRGGAGGPGFHLGRDQPGRFTPLTVTGGNVQADGDLVAGAGAGTVADSVLLCVPAHGMYWLMSRPFSCNICAA